MWVLIRKNKDRYNDNILKMRFMFVLNLWNWCLYFVYFMMVVYFGCDRLSNEYKIKCKIFYFIVYIYIYIYEYLIYVVIFFIFV